MMPMMVHERRRGPRYAMQIPIQVEQVGVGSTIDVSSGGVAFYIEAGLAPGMPIVFELRMDDERGPLVLHCDGRVLRAQPFANGVFVAATIEELVMRPAHEH